jgi:hypothetical protein
METKLFAVIAPEAAVAGTPIPGNVKSPHRKSPLVGVLWPGSLCFPASTRGLPGAKGNVRADETVKLKI